MGAFGAGWIDSIGERGDWGREHVLDPVMLGRVAAGRFACDVFRRARAAVRRRLASGTFSTGAMVRRDGVAAACRGMISGPRPVAPQRLQRQSLADRAKG